MDLMIQRVQYLLEKEIELHRLLIECLNQEYQCMVQLDVPGLNSCIQSKETVVDEIWSHENLLKKETGNSKLNEFIQKLHHEFKPQIQQLSTVLILLIEESQSLNLRNSAFAENSLEKIGEMKKNALGLNSNTSKENYSNAGLQNPISEQGGRLLSTEA